jgi:hypothetical protein
MHASSSLLLLLFIVSIDASSLMFSTKSVKGSTCLHDLETSAPLQFDRGELAEMIMRSRAIHVTKRGVRFIPSVQHLRITWPHSFPCSFPEYGSICSISNISRVLPCSPKDYIPKITGDGEILPFEYNAFLSSFDDVCRNMGEDAVGRRQTIPAPSGHAYDLTQCNFHEGEVSILYLVAYSTIYMIHGLELDSWVYILSGFLIVLNVSCITQNITHLIKPSQREANPTICQFVCFVSFIIVVSTMDQRTLITWEEYITYWYLVAYCSVRIAKFFLVDILFVRIAKFFLVDILLKKRSSSHDHASSHDHYYNLLTAILQLMVTRIHLSLCTPYTIGVVLLIGIRLFLKLHYPGYKSWYENVVMLFDAALLQLICWSGLLPQYTSMTDAYAATLVILFACIMGSRLLLLLGKEHIQAATQRS